MPEPTPEPVWDLSPEDLEELAAAEATLDSPEDGEDWQPRRLRDLSPARQTAHAVGARGEALACDLLRELGLDVITRNYHGPHGEIDVVARDGGVLCFVEVKARRHSTRTRPADAVTATKKAALARTAARYLRELGSPSVAYRFDVVEVVFLRDGRRLRDIRYWPAEFRAGDLRRPPNRRPREIRD